MRAELLAIFLLLSCGFSASLIDELQKMSEDVGDVFDQIAEVMKENGLIVEAKSEEEVKSLILTVLAFMLLLENILDIPPLFALFFAYIASAFLINHGFSNAYELFKYAFVATFSYVTLDFILRFVHFLSPITKKLFKVTGALLMLGFMRFEVFASFIESIVNYIAGGFAGFLIFLVFLILARISNMTIMLISTPEATSLRSKGEEAFSKLQEITQRLQAEEMQKIFGR